MSVLEYWPWFASAAAVLGVAVAAVKNGNTVITWLAAPLRSFRGIFSLKRENARLTLESAQLGQENEAFKAANLAFKAELTEVTKRLNDRERWEEYTTVRGGVVLRSKNADDPTRPVIYACINCFRAGGDTILQHDQYRAWLICKDHGKVGSDEPDRTAENLKKAVADLKLQRGPNSWMAR